MYLVDSKKDGI